MQIDGTFEFDREGRTTRLYRGTGYFVSMPGWELQVNSAHHTNWTHRALVGAYKVIISALQRESIQPLYLGVWTSDNITYYDISTWVEDKTTALRLGKEYNQLAIYGCAEGKALFLDKSNGEL